MNSSNCPVPAEIEKKFLPANGIELPKLENGSNIMQFYLPCENLAVIQGKLCYKQGNNVLLDLSPQDLEIVKILLSWPEAPTARLRIKENGTKISSFFTMKADSMHGDLQFIGEKPVFVKNTALINDDPQVPQDFRDNLEFERRIDDKIAYKLLYKVGGITHRVIMKTRYEVQSLYSHPFEVDVFCGPNSFVTPDRKIADNQGLTLIELELGKKEHFDPAKLPAWVGLDVSSDKRFGNKQLTLDPFNKWKQKP